MHGLIRKVIARLRLWTKNSRIIYSVALVLATTGVIGAVNDEPGIRDIAILSLLVLGVVAIFQTQQRISQRLYAEGRLTRTQIRRGGGGYRKPGAAQRGLLEVGHAQRSPSKNLEVK